MKKFHSPTQWHFAVTNGLRTVVCTTDKTIEIGIAVEYDRQHLDWEKARFALRQFYDHLIKLNPALVDIITSAYIVLCDTQDATKQYPIPVSIWAESATA